MIGDKIKEKRLDLKMTQFQLSELTGIKKNTISNYENNVSSPSEENIFKLMDALKCDANFLFDWSKVEDMKLTLQEKKHIKKYRSLDQFGKKAVDHILNDEYERCTYAEKIPVVVAARSTENKPVEVTYISKEKLEQIQNAKSVEDEVDL